jgi:hypothetical protein
LYIPPTPDSWYANLSYFLHHDTYPEYLKPRERRELILKSSRYHLINSILFRLNYDGIFLRCIEKEYVESVLKELQDGPAGDHFTGETMAHNILRIGYYCPTLFRDAHTYFRRCKVFHMSDGKENKTMIPLKPMSIYRPFEQWGIYII